MEDNSLLVLLTSAWFSIGFIISLILGRMIRYTTEFEESS